MLKTFQGKTALITGASSGIGSAIAQKLAAAGCHLVLVARDLKKLSDLALELSKTYPVRVEIFSADLSLPGAASGLFQAVTGRGISIDLLVNNAGFGKNEDFTGASAAEWESMVRLHVEAVVSLTRFFVEGMRVRGTGGILNVASTAAFQPIPFMALYSATKTFVLHFTEALWGELQPKGIRVFCLCPGNTRTDFHAKAGIAPRKIFFPAEAAEVAEFGLRKFLKSRQPFAVYGFMNRIVALGYRLFPRCWMARMAGAIYRVSRSTR
ncbi:MAG: SDR family NAD(P)-dependent oxidoreductase [Candidatus Omnitrophota bacterium]